MGVVRLAVVVLLAVDLSLRPCELLSARCQDLRAPTESAVPHWVLIPYPERRTEERSKLRESDDTIAIDSPRLVWLRPAIEILARGGETKLGMADYSQLLKVVRRASQSLGLHITPHQMRHSGASIDRARQTRTVEALRKRGRWKTVTSIFRYEKHGRLNDTWGEIRPDVQAWMRMAEAEIANVVLFGKDIGPPPRVL